MANCPHCNAEVTLASVENPRNGKWTVVPLELTTGLEGQFSLTSDMHDAVDIMGQNLGSFPVAVHHIGSGGHQYRPHSPSHYLGDAHGESA